MTEKLKTKNALIYYRCSSKAEAAETEASMRAFAAAQGFTVRYVLYDRKDKPPYILLKLSSKPSSDCSYILAPSPDELSHHPADSESMSYWLKRNGFRLVFSERGTKTDPIVKHLSDVLFFDSTAGDTALLSRKRRPIFKSKGGGRTLYGYRSVNGVITENTAESRVVRSVFEYFADGMPFAEIDARIKSEYPDDVRPSKNQLYSIVRNVRYTGYDESGERVCPQIITMRLWFDALERRFASGDTDPKYCFLFDKVRSSSGEILYPAFERMGNKRPFYISKTANGSRAVDAVAFDNAVIRMIVSKLREAAAPLKEECIRYCSDNAARLRERIDRLNQKIASSDNGADTPASFGRRPVNRVSVENYDLQITQKLLNTIALEYLQYKLTLCECPKEKIDRYFEKLSKLEQLPKEEMSYFVSRLTRRVVFAEDRITVDIMLGRTERIVKKTGAFAGFWRTDTAGK